MNCIYVVQLTMWQMCVAGGFKLWECSVDLSNFLAQQKFVFKDKIVLEVMLCHILFEW